MDKGFFSSMVLNKFPEGHILRPAISILSPKPSSHLRNIPEIDLVLDNMYHLLYHNNTASLST